MCLKIKEFILEIITDLSLLSICEDGVLLLTLKNLD